MIHEIGRSSSSSAPPDWRVQLLGELRITRAGREVPLSLPRKIGGLLGYLACFLERAHPRDALIELFWPEVDRESGRTSLRSALPILRHLFEPLLAGAASVSSPVLISDRQTVRLDPEQVTTDVAEFERNLQAAAQATSPAEEAAFLERAVLHYGGELLAVYYEPWVLAERERLAEAYVGALRHLAAARARQGDTEGAIEAARRAVQTDPLEEAAHYELIRQYAAAGQMAAARRQYQELERLLKEELAATPSQDFEDLLDAGEPSPVTSDRQTEQPVAPEAATSAPRLTVPPLPVPMTPIIGRETEISHVRAMLESSRLVTLTGLGGTGKTRLALEVARLLQEEGWCGVGFVSLADLTDASLLGERLLEALRFPESGAADPIQQIATLIADQSFLLVLDNFEQLVEEGAEAVQHLLERAPRLVCLVTSRRLLGLSAERDYLVAPLPTPVPAAAPEQLMEFASVRLFMSRAQAARPDFRVTAVNAAAVALLCRALEGIPLALELAAARAPVLTPAQMLEHLSDRFGFLVSPRRAAAERHRTLHAALEWSYQTLLEPQQRLLARLSVFRGGWTLEAAAVVDREPDHALRSGISTTLDALMDLRDASLVIAEEEGEAVRFRMLETVREYSEGRLAERGEAEAARTRHRDWCLELAERAEEELDGPASALWLDRLDAERENLRAALAWCLRSVDSGQWLVDSPTESGAQPERSPSAPTTNHQPLSTALRLAGALGRFWEVRGYTREGRFYLAEVLGRNAGELSYQGERARPRAKALMWAGVLAHGQTEYRSARAQYEESLALHQQSGDRAGIAAVLYRLGNLSAEQGNSAEAGRFHEESLAIRRELGDQTGIALSLNSLGNIALDQGDYESARSRYEESLFISRQRGDQRGWCWSRHFLGVVAEHGGDFALARSIYEECLPVWRELRSQVQVAWVLHGIGYVAYRQGDFPVACSRLAESLTLFREMDYTGGLVRTLDRLGGLAVARGDMERACRLLAAAASQRAATGGRTALAPPQEFEGDVAAVRSNLNPEAFAAAWAEGQAMTLAQAIEYALQEDGA
jgi:predicted ATPase/DNA-binding SARP family transcriptional activator